MGKLIFINRYFYPDHSATSQLLTDLTIYLAKGSEDVHVIASKQQYDNSTADLKAVETIKNVHVHRIWTTKFGRFNLIGRAVDYGSFYFSALFHLLILVKRGDTIIAKTDPPLISIFSSAIAKLKGAKALNWLQDLFPEVAEALGIKGIRNKFVNWVLKHLRNRSLVFASKNIVIGELMKDRLLNEGILRDQIEVIHNWADSEFVYPVAVEKNMLRHKWGLDDKFVVGYSGNLGRAHEFDTILGAAESLRSESRVVFLFTGGGVLYERLNVEVGKRGLTNFIFKSYQPREALSESLSVSNIHLITLRPELEGLIVPSKFYGIAGVGRPVIYIGDINGEIPKILQKENCGFCVNIGEAKLLSNKISELANNESLVSESGCRARALFERQFSSEIQIMKWNTLLVDID